MNGPSVSGGGSTPPEKNGGNSGGGGGVPTARREEGRKMTAAESLLYEVKNQLNRGVDQLEILSFIESHETVGGVFVAPKRKPSPDRRPKPQGGSLGGMP